MATLKPVTIDKINPAEEKANAFNVQACKLFAQCIHDMLFDYTIDSFKASALNSHTAARELDTLINKIDSGIIKPGSILPVIEELKFRIRNDPVLRISQKQSINNLLESVDTKTIVKP